MPAIWRPDTQHADQYFHAQGVESKTLGHSGFACLPVLEFLWGQPWDNLALSCVQALRPDAIRVTTGGCTTDWQPWRVTVDVRSDRRTIERIEQELEVPLYAGRNGDDLLTALRERGIDLNRCLPGPNAHRPPSAGLRTTAEKIEMLLMCEKCGSCEAQEVEYMAGKRLLGVPLLAPCMKDCPESEHLHLQCPRCGHRAHRPCRDAEKS